MLSAEPTLSKPNPISSGGKRIREAEVQPEQVADRIVVLLPVQPPDHDRCRADLLAALGGQEVVFDPRDDPVELLATRAGACPSAA